MSNAGIVGVLYTEYTALRAATPLASLASLWSYETRAREPDRQPVMRGRDGSDEYWLDRSDPLLNTILPSTHVSLVFNLGDPWAAGRSLVTSAQIPPACVIGPATRPRILRVGKAVRAIGTVIPPTMSRAVLGTPASELVDRIVPLDHLWTRGDVDRILSSDSGKDIGVSASSLMFEALARGRPCQGDASALPLASELIRQRGGRISIGKLATDHGLSRQQFARRFRASAGVSPKLFARLTRFQSLLHDLLSTDVAKWSRL